ncbi:MAG: gephyrin-like molybdotransferase Glp [Pseudomonadota bacterium]
MRGVLPNDCFALPPGVDWVPVDDAKGRLLSRLTAVAEIETCSVAAALGRVLANSVTACRPHPAHRNAAVDGFAVRLDDGERTEYGLVDGAAAAGHPSDYVLRPGEAIRILTGAEVPDATDAVVLQEDVSVRDQRVYLPGPPKPGANIRSRGEDTAEGAVILEKGHRLTVRDLAYAISVGVERVECFKPLKVGVISSGDEIVPPGADARAHQVFDANRPMLLSQVLNWGYEAINLGHVGDDRKAVERALREAVAQCDAVITSGGASAGAEDHISAVLGDLADRHTWRIALKPGRPLALAQWDGVPIFGLPGNPIAAFVCTLIFARPALQLLQGRKLSEPQGYDLPAAFAKTKKPGRTEYLRARVNADGAVEVFGSEGSGRVSGLSWAEGLVGLPHGAVDIKPDDKVRYLPFSSFD